MENYRGGLKAYWKRQAYTRVDGTGGERLRRRRTKRAELGDGRRRRRFWKIRIPRKLRFLRGAVSPLRILARIRDGYVRMMLAFAGSGIATGYGYGYGNAVGYPSAAEGGFGKPPAKEYDEKTIIEMYKAILARGEVLPAGGANKIALQPIPE